MPQNRRKKAKKQTKNSEAYLRALESSLKRENLRVIGLKEELEKQIGVESIQRDNNRELYKLKGKYHLGTRRL